MITTGKTGQEWRFCSDLTWRSFYVVPDRSSRRKAEPTFSPHPTSAHIYALGVSAVSHRTLMCFKEVSLDLPPILPPSLFLSLSLASSILRAADPRGFGALKRARRSDS